MLTSTSAVLCKDCVNMAIRYCKLPTAQTTVSLPIEGLAIVEEYARIKGISRSWACFQVFAASPLLLEWAQVILDHERERTSEDSSSE